MKIRSVDVCLMLEFSSRDGLKNRDVHLWYRKLIAVLYFWALNAQISLFEAEGKFWFLTERRVKFEYWLHDEIWLIPAGTQCNTFLLNHLPSSYRRKCCQKISLFVLIKSFRAGTPFQTSGSATSGNMFISPAVHVWLGRQSDKLSLRHTHSHSTKPHFDYEMALLDVL